MQRNGVAAWFDEAPLSRAHVHLLLIAGLGYAFDGMDGSALAFFLPVLRATWHLSAWQAGLIASSTSQGYLIGSLAAGFLADRYGRRRIMMSALGVYCVASMLSACVHDWGVYFALRVVCGIGTGAEAVVIIPYIAEFLPARRRGGLCGAVVGFYAFGYMAAAALGALIVPAFPAGWRLASFMTGLPVLLLLWWRRALPESPRWLEQKGRPEEARSVMERFTALPLWTAVDSFAESETSIPRFAESPWRGRLALCIWIWTWLFFSFYGFFSWIPSLLMANGLNMSRSFGLSFLIFSAQAPGYFIAAWFNGVIGRRRVMIAALAVAAAAALGLAGAHGTTALVLSAMGLSAGLNGTVAGLYAYMPELFPTRLRASAMGLSSGISRLGAISGALLMGPLAAWGGGTPVFALTGSALLLALLALIFVAPETSDTPLPEGEAVS